MNTALPTPEPDDVQRGLTELERYVAGHGPVPVLPVVEREHVERDERPVRGETKRVLQLRAQVEESHLVADLQADETPLEVDSPRVRRMRLKAAEAAKLHTLSQDPQMRAYKAARARRLFTIVLVTSLVLALGWSTAGVQKFAADDAAPHSAAWWFAWCVEPFISLGLLGVVGSRSYMAIQGSPLTGGAESTAKKIEWTFLGLSLGMNAFPYLPGVADPFDLDRLVIHILGPIVAVAVVIYLSIHLKGFNDLDVHQGVTGPLTGPRYRENTAAPTGVGNPSAGPDLAALVAKVQRLISSGELPAEPSANAIRQLLRCRMDTARAVRDALRHPAA